VLALAIITDESFASKNDYARTVVHLPQRAPRTLKQEELIKITKTKIFPLVCPAIAFPNFCFGNFDQYRSLCEQNRQRSKEAEPESSKRLGASMVECTLFVAA
jgi:hypothetical protein